MARDGGVRSGPSLVTVAHPLIAIPESTKPYSFGEKSTTRKFAEDILGEDDMPILIGIVHVLVAVLDFVWVVRHSNFNEIIYDLI